MIIKKISDSVGVIDGGFSSGIYTFVNPYSYMKLRRFSDMESIDYVLVDGISAVLFFNMIGVSCRRYSFDMTSIAPEVFKWCEAEKKTIAFVGGHEGVVEKAMDSIKKNHPLLNVVMTRSGYFKDENERVECVKYIADVVAPDVVVVGMGAPIQEDFLVSLKKNGWVGLGFTCGGFLHQTSLGRYDYYPKFFDKYNLRWLYRIYDEPKLLKRYLVQYPQFIYSVLLDFASFKKNG